MPLFSRWRTRRDGILRRFDDLDEQPVWHGAEVGDRGYIDGAKATAGWADECRWHTADQRAAEALRQLAPGTVIEVPGNLIGNPAIARVLASFAAGDMRITIPEPKGTHMALENVTVGYADGRATFTIPESEITEVAAELLEGDGASFDLGTMLKSTYRVALVSEARAIATERGLDSAGTKNFIDGYLLAKGVE